MASVTQGLMLHLRKSHLQSFVSIEHSAKMRAHSSARARACTALTLLLTMATTAPGRRPAGHSPPLPSHGGSGQTMTLYTAGATPPEPKSAVPSSQRAVFTSQGPLVGHSGSLLRALTQSAALRPGAVAAVDERFHGKIQELGLPLGGSLQGVIVTSLEDNSSHIVAVKASFAGNGGAEDSLRFFGVHHDGREESHVAVVGGTGRYDGASGFAVVRAADVPGTGGSVGLSRMLSFRVHLK